MATIPQTRPEIPAKDDYAVDDNDYPGYTVDALLAQDKVEEARAEFERLCLEGVDSGPAINVTPEFWREFRAELKEKAERLP